MNRLVYFFGGGKAEGTGGMRDILGGKGAALAEMTNAGLPVPPGFTISTEVCRLTEERQGSLPEEVESQVQSALARLEQLLGKRFGGDRNPLLVAVRSGAPVSMPGMMDTVLNVGLNPESVEALAESSGSPRFAWDLYRRLVQMFGDVVMGVPKSVFDEIFDSFLDEAGLEEPTDLSAEKLREMAAAFKTAIVDETGRGFPDDPAEQLQSGIGAVFRSWRNPRAAHYRRMNGIPDDLGTAVNIQAMVFGNLGPTSATGVGFTRNPSTGNREFYGEYLPNAQGEDVVAGIRTPVPIARLREVLPEAYAELERITTRLERHYRDVQDFEFTIEEGRLYMLQTRTGKRTGPAAVRIAVDMAREGLIRESEAVMRVSASQIEQLLHPQLDPASECRVLATGLPASPGAASGRLVFTADEAVKLGSEEPVILVRKETVPDDIHGMEAAAAVLTAKGGMTSHAAVVARGMGKCCVVGVESLIVDERGRAVRIGSARLGALDWLTLDGTTGRVIEGRMQTVAPDSTAGPLGEFMELADRIRRLRVRANADTPRDAELARRLGAEGIGLCRTEHMFFADDRLPIVQQMILASSERERRSQLDRLLPLQREDFAGMFRAMSPLPVTIRLLDPPLHEFLPKKEELAVEVALLRQSGADADRIEDREGLLRRVEELSEFNPMMGHRGCRLAMTYPEISEMQVRAILEAACETRRAGIDVHPEIMVPLVAVPEELAEQRRIIERTAAAVFAEQKMEVGYLVGTMIELPRAALAAEAIAAEADFFSFGTNDLTQMTFGFSRDDSVHFIDAYRRRGILRADPFGTLDREGVGTLMRMASENGRRARPVLKLGVCGEHGGDPDSVEFFHRLGVDYVSCSPYRVPVARLAAAQAVIEASGDDGGASFSR